MTNPALKGARWVVAGAGVLGASIAWKLALAGADVTLCDPAAAGDNASGIAAGMLAPAFEAALDPETGLDFAHLIAARDLWPAFAAQAGIDLDRSGAIRAGLDAERVASVLASLGAEHRILTGAQSAALSPGLNSVHPAVFTPEDWRLDAPGALGRLIIAARAAGARIVLAALTGFEPGQAVLSTGETIAAGGLVAATGWGAATRWGAALAPELSCLVPIKGQLLRSTAGPIWGPVVRGAGVYIAPAPGGAVVGATMQTGASNRAVEPAVIERLLAGGAALYPALAGAAFTPSAAVRAATPDGLPLVGASIKPGVLLAAGARRNGWLLAPLIAERIVCLAAGSEESAGAFDPARFAAGQGAAG
jgi:glycine oxidase